MLEHADETHTFPLSHTGQALWIRTLYAPILKKYNHPRASDATAIDVLITSLLVKRHVRKWTIYTHACMQTDLFGLMVFLLNRRLKKELIAQDMR